MPSMSNMRLKVVISHIHVMYIYEFSMWWLHLRLMGGVNSDSAFGKL
jgi:hypothetical protein